MGGQRPQRDGELVVSFCKGESHRNGQPLRHRGLALGIQPRASLAECRLTLFLCVAIMEKSVLCPDCDGKSRIRSRRYPIGYKLSYQPLQSAIHQGRVKGQPRSLLTPKYPGPKQISNSCIFTAIFWCSPAAENNLRILYSIYITTSPPSHTPARVDSVSVALPLSGSTEFASPVYRCRGNLRNVTTASPRLRR